MGAWFLLDAVGGRVVLYVSVSAWKWAGADVRATVIEVASMPVLEFVDLFGFDAFQALKPVQR